MLRTRTDRQLKTARRFSASAAPFSTAVILAACAALTSPRTAFADGLPSQAAPEGFRSTNNGAGGRILDGALSGVSSPQESVHAGLHKLSAYFGGTLEVTGAVRSTDDKSTTAFFHATLHGTPITGLSIIAWADNGGSREAVLFDTSAHFATSLPSLSERLKSLPVPRVVERSGSGGAEAPHVAIPTLHAHEASDGTIGISIPSDWRILALAEGRAVVGGPNDEFIQLNMSAQFITAGSPRAQRNQQMAQFTHTKVPNPFVVAPFSDDVGQAYINGSNAQAQAMGKPDPQIHIDRVIPQKPGWGIINATRIGDNGKRRVVGTVSAQRGAYDSWTLDLWVAAGPDNEYKRVFPTMLAIENSLTYNAQKDHDLKAKGTEMIIAASKAAMAESKSEHDAFEAGQQSRFDSSMAAARASQDSIDRSAAGMIHVINGTSVLEHTTTGAHGNFDSGFSSWVAQQDPAHFRVVPMSEYRKGVDY